MTFRLSALSLSSVALVLSSVLLSSGPQAGHTAAAPDLDRSPIDLAVTQDGRWAVTANNTSDTVSLVDLESGKVVDETKVGHRPFGIALTKDRNARGCDQLLVKQRQLLDKLWRQAYRDEHGPMGDEPRGVAIAPDGSRAYVALAGAKAELCRWI